MSTLKHHPDTATLVEFSAGTLEPALAMCVSAHLHFCDRCKNELMRLDQVGSQIMGEADPAEVDEQLFDKVMAKIDDLPEQEKISLPASENNYPPLVEKLVENTGEDLIWRKMSASVDIARLKTGQNDYEVALHKICAGGKTPKHGHSGREFTVVLKGSFSDENSVYTEGDFIMKAAGDEHQPMGAQNGECICLSALEAPIKLSSKFGFLMKPWLRINPM